MKKEFVSYNIALELKSLGFNELCFGYFNSKGNLKLADCSISINEIPFYYKNSECEIWLSSLFLNKKVKSKICVAPLWQQVIDWFREEYGLHISFEPVYKPQQFTNLMYCYAISTKKNFYSGMDENLDNWIGLNDGGNMFHITNSYYSAREQAILKAIELCKKN